MKRDNDGPEEVVAELAEEVLRRRDKMADALERTSERLQRKGEALGNGVSAAAHKTAGAVESAGHYLREFDGDELVSDVRGIVKRHPGRTVLAALVVGFFIGRAIRSNDS